MGHIEIDIERIRKCVDILVMKAKEEIPLMPTETQSIQHYPIKMDFYINEIPFVLSFSCSPPLVTDTCRFMMISCDVTIPTYGIALERPSMYKSVDEILQELEKDLTKESIIKDFVDLLEDIDFNYGHVLFYK